MTKFECYVDGGADNYHHNGAYGSFAIFDKGHDRMIQSRTFILDAKTSNEAEYMSLINLLRYIINEFENYNDYFWDIRSDSNLVVSQLNPNRKRRWRVRATNLIPLHRLADNLLRRIQHKNIKWISNKIIKSILGH